MQLHTSNSLAMQPNGDYPAVVWKSAGCKVCFAALYTCLPSQSQFAHFTEVAGGYEGVTNLCD